MPCPRITAPLALALCALAVSGGCAASQVCRVTPWLEVEHSRRVEPLPGLGYGEQAATVRVRLAGGQVEVERLSVATWHRAPDAVLALLLDGPGGAAREAHVFREGLSTLQRFPLAACHRPLVLAERGAVICWSCETEPAPGETGCPVALFSELDLEGATRWDRRLALPTAADARPCHVEELYGLTAEGNPAVQVACPAPAGSRWIDPWVRADAELRPGGPVELLPAAIPRPRSSLPWVDARCPRWAPGP